MDSMTPQTPAHPAAPRRGDLFTTPIERLAFGGRGVGHAPDGRVAFVDGAVPGDTVEASYTRIKKDFVEAVLSCVLEPSSVRVAPRCRHFGACGGCRLQQLSYPVQAAQKARQVTESLSHIGGLDDVPVLPVVEADSEWFYRNKMEFAFAPTPEGGLVLGLHRRGRFDRIEDLSECWLLDERAGRLLEAVRRWARASGLPAYESRQATGLLRYLVVRIGKTTGQALVDLVTAADEPPAPASFVEAVLGVFGEATVVHTTHKGRATAYMFESQQALHGPGVIDERIGDFVFEISPSSFFQTNSSMALRLYQVAARAAALTGSERLLDLYCGTGTIGIMLSKNATRVVGLESNEAAVADAEKNTARNGITNVSFVAAKAEEALEGLLAAHGPFDVAVVDPPRAGLHPKALAALMRSNVGRIAYVSCNPATLSRDVAALAVSGFACEWVQPIDMFPQTPHVEAVAALRRADA